MAKILSNAAGIQERSTVSSKFYSILTPSELIVCDELLNGKQNSDIAVALGVAEISIKHHLLRASKKMGAMNRVHLALMLIGFLPETDACRKNMSNKAVSADNG